MENNNLQLKLDIRYPVTMKGEELFASIEKHIAQIGAKAVLRNNSVPCYKPADTPEIKTLLAAYDHVTGEKGVPYTIGGGTYARRFDNAVAFGPHFHNMPNPCGEGKGEEHMPDECNSVDFLMKALKIHRTLAKRQKNRLVSQQDCVVMEFIRCRLKRQNIPMNLDMRHFVGFISLRSVQPQFFAPAIQSLWV